jgi:hypothetical protein
MTPLVEALNLERLRVKPPRRFIFFCGGKIELTKRPQSLRDFLCRKFADRSAIKDGHIVLAESATGLFRDSRYNDLIAFEADIAQISDIVLLVAESAGSLTELGAFSIHPEIAPHLLIFIRDDYYNAESFIRHGPVRSLENGHPGSVLYYPWRTRKDGTLKVSSASSDLRAMKGEIEKKLFSNFKAEKFDKESLRHRMILMFWCIWLLRGASLSEITSVIQLFGISINQNEAHKFLYCMKVAEWIADQQYGNTIYYYSRVDVDPFEYAFRDSARSNDPIRWKSDIKDSMRRAKLQRPSPIVKAAGG